MLRILFILFLTVSTVSLSQNPISFGVKAGVNISNLGGRDFVLEPNSIIGFHLGLATKVEISDAFFIQTELLYSQVGGQFKDEFFTVTGPDDPGTLVNSENTLKFSYINLPILAQYKVAKGLSLGAGPQLGFNINSISESSSLVGGESVEEDISETIESFELGLALNAQYDLPFGLFGQVRYVLGLTNIDATEVPEGGISLNQDPLLNRAFQVSVGYIF